MNKKIITILILITLILIAFFYYLNNYGNERHITITDGGTVEINPPQPAPRELFISVMGYVWIWKETHNWQGPDSLIDGKIVPSKPGAFTITFNKDGTVSGTTDCNSFSGTYILDEKILGRVTFGPFALTKMFCEGSQEIEYIAMLRESHFSIGENNLYLETDNIKTVIFDKRE